MVLLFYQGVFRVAGEEEINDGKTGDKKINKKG